MEKPKAYIINFQKVLGTGATASVYLGIRSVDGLRCALKCSKRPLMDEVNTMKVLEHTNIIKFYDNLQSFQGFDSVICMEYCNQGSLYEFAELHQGLCDNMFLKVLECLHQGIYYLRGKTLIHRDIKPGNMMVHQDNMGDYHVKLGDLGTAKKVVDGAKFETLCGTVEYLHPDMYIGYIEQLDMQFKASADLWSMGVTLYHAAIFELPFIPFIKSRPTYASQCSLKEMYLNKGQGIISGRQNSENRKDITWSDTFPETCQLSPMLKDLASKLIGNLMDLSDANTYDRFFEEANRISQKKRILTFNSLNGELQILYLDSLTYNSVTDQIAKSTGYAKEELIILTKDKKLVSPTEIDTQCFRSLAIKGHLTYKLTSDTALIVVNKAVTGIPTLVNKRALISECQGPQEKYEKFKDAKHYSGTLLGSLYQVNHSSNYTDCQMDCFLATANAFDKLVLDDNRRLLQEALPWQMKAITDVCLMSDSLLEFSKEISKGVKCSEDFINSLTKYGEEVHRLRSAATNDEDRWYTTTSVDMMSKKLLIGMEYTVYEKEDAPLRDNLDFLVHSAEELVNEMKLLPKDSLKDDPDQYKLDVWRRHLELFECYNLSKKIFTAKSEQVIKMQQSFSDWLQPALADLSAIVTLRDSLHRHEETRLIIRSKFLQTFESLQQMFQKMNLGDSIANFATLDIADANTVRSKIYEIREITERMKRGQRLNHQ